MSSRSNEFNPSWYHRPRVILGGTVIGLALAAGAPLIADALTNPPSQEEVQSLQEVASQYSMEQEGAQEANRALAQAQGAEASPETAEKSIRGLGVIIVLLSGANLIDSTPAGRRFVGLGQEPTTGPQ